MPYQTQGVVIRNRRIKSVYYLMEIECPPIAAAIKPGQFIMLKISDNHSPLLRRPFSVYKSYPENHTRKTRKNHFSILYKEVGKGTKMMSQFRKGRKMDILGPLGNGFSIPSSSTFDKVVLIGGGIGIVSLYSLAEVFKESVLYVLIGGKTVDDILCLEDFKKLKSKVFVATEDGSLGLKGTAIDLFLSLRDQFKKERVSIYSCGPMAMLRALQRKVKTKNLICQASLETRMACGIGACWGCVVRTNDPITPFHRVCKDGPVFNIRDILWEGEAP